MLEIMLEILEKTNTLARIKDNEDIVNPRYFLANKKNGVIWLTQMSSYDILTELHLNEKSTYSNQDFGVEEIEAGFYLMDSFEARVNIQEMKSRLEATK
jgi:hypothetical protein